MWSNDNFYCNMRSASLLSLKVTIIVKRDSNHDLQLILGSHILLRLHFYGLRDLILYQTKIGQVEGKKKANDAASAAFHMLLVTVS